MSRINHLTKMKQLAPCLLALLILIPVAGVAAPAERKAPELSTLSDAELKAHLKAEHTALMQTASEQAPEPASARSRSRRHSLAPHTLLNAEDDPRHARWQRYQSAQQELQRRERLKPKQVHVPPPRSFPEDMPPERKAYLQAADSLHRAECRYLCELGPLNDVQREAASRQWRAENQQHFADLEALRTALHESPEMQARRAPPRLTSEQLQLKETFELATPEERRELLRAYREQLLQPTTSATQR